MPRGQQAAGAPSGQAQATRSASQESRQQAASSNQAARQQSASSTTSSNQAARQQSRGDAQQDRQDYASSSREDWQDHQQRMQEDRQDAWNDELDNVYRGGAYWHGGYVNTVDSGDLAAAAVLVAGTAVTVSAIHSMTTPSASRPAACTMTTAVINDVTYYHCAPNWFQKAYVKGEMTYIAIAPPPGY